MKRNSGQVLLLVVITMIVALTAGLALASRITTNLKLSKQNEDSQRAFQAASAGIDKYINSSSGTTLNSINSSNFKTNVTQISGSTMILNNGNTIDQDRGIDVWLSNYPNYK
ncbi:MAG: hypothetical protein ACM3IJ_01825 [Candidatus Levyibacteriota bacterium]